MITDDVAARSGYRLVCALTASFVLGSMAVSAVAHDRGPASVIARCDQSHTCPLEENCDCAVPGVTVRWRAAYCMALEQTDDLEQAAVQRCLGRPEPAALRTLKACAKNEYWKRQVCATTNQVDVDACVRDQSFIPAIVSRGGV